MSLAQRPPAELTRSDSALRREYLHEVADLLWPAPASVVADRPRGARADGVVSEFVVVPSLDRPRLLIPLGSRRAAATALRRYSEPRGRLARYRLEALALAMASGVGPAVMRDRVRIVADDVEAVDSIETYLAESIGRRARLSLHIGPARANRKPVLQLLSDRGDVLGFVKVGVNDLTRRLVAAEARSLSSLGASGLNLSQVPEVVHAGTWRGLEVLVQSPLPVWEKRVPLRPGQLSSAMLELAQVSGVHTERLVSSGFWARLGAGLDGLADGAAVHQLREAFAAITDRAAEAQVPLGAWHGDWTPWNCAAVAHRLLVWDWERFEEGVPLGLDALHYDLQRSVVGRNADPRLAVAGTMARSAELLAPFGIDPEHAPLVALSYLMALATRYLQDGQAEAGARLGVLGQWLLPELVERVQSL
jgi:hypothetical protein